MERLATFFDRLGHKYKERDLHVLVNTGVLVTAYATLLVVATSAEAEKVRKHYVRARGHARSTPDAGPRACLIPPARHSA